MKAKDASFIFIIWSHFRHRGHKTKYYHKRDFPGGPVVRTPLFHGRGHGLDPWSGKFHMLCSVTKKKNFPKKKKLYIKRCSLF